MRPLHAAALITLFLLNAAGPVAAEAQPVAPPAPAAQAAVFAAVDRVFEDFALDTHIPGLVIGVVAQGRLLHVRGFGVQDLASMRPVTPDSLFRIASMTKAFTALTVLQLRDEGRLRLDELAEIYVPEMRAWKYPTQDSPRIRVRDLLNHTAGFVTDDPWGDRQTPLPEAAFTQLLREGVPWARAPGLAMEYSNLGYALLGRIITNVTGRPYADEIDRRLLVPLGMAASGFQAAAAPPERRAQGYRWQDHAWALEATMPHGAFGAMGGVQTSAADYARWIAFLLSAWPARDAVDSGPVRRATVREMAQGSNFPRLLTVRPAGPAQDPCRRAIAYGMGLTVSDDCEFGTVLSHGGGFPGYGSFMLLLPDKGVGLFAFANRTYAGPSRPLYEAAALLKKAGFLDAAPAPVAVAVSAELAEAYRAAGAIYQTGDVKAGAGLLADNFLMDRDAAGWARDLSALRQQVGACDTTAAVVARHALAGSFTWRCSTGRLTGNLLLSPTRPPRIQALEIAVK